MYDKLVTLYHNLTVLQLDYTESITHGTIQGENFMRYEKHITPKLYTA